jgi:hypothetical protein
MNPSSGMPPKEKVNDWLQKLNTFGPRYTGSSAHKASINFLADELAKLGLEVHKDKQHISKWEANDWHLSVENVQGEWEELPVSFYYPYSGQTPDNGIEAEMVNCGSGPGNFKHAAGKIAVVEVNNLRFPTSLLLKKRTAYPRNERVPFLLRNSTVSAVLRGPDLEKARQAGVRGIIAIWRNISKENAQNQYLRLRQNRTVQLFG